MSMADFPDNHKGTNDNAMALPHNIDAEQAILGSMLMDNRLFEEIADMVDRETFFDPLHGALFDQIVGMIEKGHLANPITLKSIVDTWPAIHEHLEVWQYLGSLVSAATSRYSIRAYAQTLVDLADRRRVIALAQDLYSYATTAPADVSTTSIIEEAERGLFEIAAKRTEGREIELGGAVTQALDAMAAAYERGGSLHGVPTGLVDLDAKLGGFQNSDLIILGGRPSMGKAQPTDAPVKMRNGEWKNIGDLRMGDALASMDGAASVVSGVFPQGRKQIYRVTFSDGRTAECCAEHLWQVYNRKWPAPKVMSAQSIMSLLVKPSMKNRLWIDLVSGHFGSADALPIAPWTLGALIGNGNLSRGTPIFSTSSTHTAYALKTAVGADFRMEQCSSYDFRIVQAEGRSRPGIFGVSENPLMAAIKTLGLHGLRSEQKFIPRIYQNADRSARMSLLRGLLDTDGWVEKHGTVRFGTSSPRLRDDVCELVRSLGGICTAGEKIPFYTHKGERKAGLPTFTLNIMMDDYSECFSEPKKAALIREKRSTRLTFDSIEPIDERDAVCISVTHPSRLYVTSDYVVTHNTALATTIAFNVAKEKPDADGVMQPGGHVHLFSMEMSAQQLAMRLISEQSEISSDALRRGKISEADMRHAIERAKGVAAASMTVDETGGISMAALAAKARRTKRKRNTQLIVIDYLQLMSGAGKGNDNRVQEITKLTMGLKALAKELDVPIVALSQLSRKVEERADKRPQLSDLRESGSIEQDADVVMFVYRDEYYVEREKPDEFETAKYADWQARMERSYGKAEVIVGKQRHGSVGTVMLSFQSRFTRFANLAPERRHAS